MKSLFIAIFTIFNVSIFAQTPAENFTLDSNTFGDVALVWESNGLVVARFYDGVAATWDPPLASPATVLDVGTNSAIAVAINETGDVLVTWTHDPFPSNRVIKAARYDLALTTWFVYPVISDPLSDDPVNSIVTIDAGSNGQAVWLLDDGTLQSSLYDVGTDTWSTPPDELNVN